MKTDLVDPTFWEKLSALEPGEVCHRSWATYDPQKGYLIYFTKDEIVCCPKERKIFRVDETGEHDVESQLRLVIVHYLINADETCPSGMMVTEKELTGGAFFFKGLHKLPLASVEERFQGRPREFLQAGLSLGAVAKDYGDASFELRVLPKIKAGFIFHDRDDEFPARCVMTFDSSIDRHLPLDAIWAMVNVLVNRLIHYPQPLT